MIPAPPFDPGDVVECVRIGPGAPAGLKLGELYNVRQIGTAHFPVGLHLPLETDWGLVLNKSNLPAGRGLRCTAFRLVMRRDRSLIPRLMATPAPDFDAIAERSEFMRLVAQLGRRPPPIDWRKLWNPGDEEPDPA